MKILGVSDGARPSAVLVGDGELLGAACAWSEPGASGLAPQVVDDALAAAGCALSDVHRVVFGSHMPLAGRLPGATFGMRRIPGSALVRQLLVKETGLWTVSASRRREHEAARLAQRGFRGDTKTIDHFLALGEAAWRTQAHERALVFTATTGGDGTTLTVSLGDHDGLQLLQRQGGMSSLRSYRELVAGVEPVTEDPSFDPWPHLGVDAVAPRELSDLFYEHFHVSARGFGFSLSPLSRRLTDRLGAYADEEVSAAWEHNLEVQFRRLIRHWIRRTGVGHVAVAGEVFANTQLTHGLLEIRDLRTLHVFPEHGDPALATGAALRFGDVGPRPLDHLYLGLRPVDSRVLGSLGEHGLRESAPMDLPSSVAQLLHEGAVVGRVAGREAWADPALGNRSVLCSPRHRDAARELAVRIGRSVHLPVTTLIPKGAAPRFLGDLARVDQAARFGSVLVPATAQAEAAIPGSILPGALVRPQLLRDGENPALGEILSRTGDLSGAPVLLAQDLSPDAASSVDTAARAVRLLAEGRIDALVVGDHLVETRSS